MGRQPTREPKLYNCHVRFRRRVPQHYLFGKIQAVVDFDFINSLS